MRRIMTKDITKEATLRQTSNNTSSERVPTPKLKEINEVTEDTAFLPPKLLSHGASIGSTHDYHTNLNASEHPAESQEEPSEARKEIPKKRKVKLKSGPTAIPPPKYTARPNKCDNDPNQFQPDKQDYQQNPPQSYIYVKSQTGTNFRLHFVATDAHFEPLFICPRKSRPRSTDKLVQVFGHERVYDEYNTTSERLFMTRPKFIADPSLDAPEKVVLPPLRVYTTGQLYPKAEPISRPQRSATTGFIYLKFNNILMQVRVKPLPITKIKLPVTEDVKEKMEKLNMPTSDTTINRAQLIVRNKNDVLKVLFTLSECSLSRLPERKSLAIQTETRVVLRHEYNKYGQKMVYLPIPETTYIYKDPMIDIRRLNNHFAKLKISPLWKHELFHKRVSEMRGGSTIEQMVDKVIKSSRGSFLTFEGFNAVATANGGLLCARISDGLDKYEETMFTYLGTPTKEPELQEENVSNTEIKQMQQILQRINHVDLTNSEL